MISLPSEPGSEVPSSYLIELDSFDSLFSPLVYSLLSCFSFSSVMSTALGCSWINSPILL